MDSAFLPNYEAQSWRRALCEYLLFNSLHIPVDSTWCVFLNKTVFKLLKATLNWVGQGGKLFAPGPVSGFFWPCCGLNIWWGFLWLNMKPRWVNNSKGKSTVYLDLMCCMSQSNLQIMNGHITQSSVTGWMEPPSTPKCWSTWLIWRAGTNPEPLLLWICTSKTATCWMTSTGAMI